MRAALSFAFLLVRGSGRRVNEEEGKYSTRILIDVSSLVIRVAMRVFCAQREGRESIRSAKAIVWSVRTYVPTTLERRTPLAKLYPENRCPRI